jgi:membrane protein required for colicin V production
LDINYLDGIIVLSAVFCLVRGIMRGAISQVFGIAGLLAGLGLASRFFEDLAFKLSKAFPQLPGVEPISFGILFFLTWLCIAILGYWVTRLVRLTGLAFWDRFWGGLLGGAKSLLFAIVVVSFLTFLLTPQNPILRGSLVAPYVLDAAQWLIKIVPLDFRSFLEKKGEELKRYRLNGDQKEKDQNVPKKKEKEGQPA